MPMEYLRQTNFNGGELSPQAVGRRDLKAYTSSLAISVNMVARPEGPMTRRPGLRHVDLVRQKISAVPLSQITVTAPNGGTPAGALDGTGLLTTTDMGTTRPYVIATFDMGGPTAVGLIDLINMSLYPVGGGVDPGGGDPSPPQYPWTGGGGYFEVDGGDGDRPTEVLP